jgi:hypothetical protein
VPLDFFRELFITKEVFKALNAAVADLMHLQTSASEVRELWVIEPNKHSEKARAPHTNGPRDVPRCGALSLQQKLLHYKRGFTRNPAQLLCMWAGVWALAHLLLAPAFNSRGT